jgi:hypothetical protein
VTAIVTPQSQEVNLGSPITSACIAHKSVEICERCRLFASLRIARMTIAEVRTSRSLPRIKSFDSGLTRDTDSWEF